MSRMLKTCVVLLVMLLSLPMLQAAAAEVSGTTYTDANNDITLEWTTDWDVTGDYPGSVRLSRGDGTVLKVGVWDAETATVEEMLAPLDGETIVEDHSDATPPSVVVQSADEYVLIEVHEINDILVNVTLLTTEAQFEDSLRFVQQEITLNGQSVFSSEALTGDDASTGDSTRVTRTSRGSASDETPEATEESNGVTRTSRGSAGDETPEATEESTGVTRTSRGSHTDETPAATEPPAGVTRTSRGSSTDETPEVVGDLQSFTGPVFSYTLQYDPNIWTEDGVFEDEGMDGIRLITDSSTLTVWAWSGYGADSQACLQGESDFYDSEVDSISDWQVAENARGEELQSLSDDVSWGVFTLNYEGSPLVDYISCQPIPGQDAVLIVLLSSTPEDYNDSLSTSLDVTDTFQFSDTSAASVSTTNQGSRAEISTSVDGTVYTSPNYGFTINVPLEWAVVEEDPTAGDEKLVLDNGTSLVTIWATDTAVGDLEGCVDYAASRSGFDLVLDESSTGGDFRGVYGDQAFGNFVYEDDGIKMMYFIGCRPIPGADANLIVIQNVEYSQFTSQRRYRIQIEESIVFP